MKEEVSGIRPFNGQFKLLATIYLPAGRCAADIGPRCDILFSTGHSMQAMGRGRVARDITVLICPYYGSDVMHTPVSSCCGQRGRGCYSMEQVSVTHRRINYRDLPAGK